MIKNIPKSVIAEEHDEDEMKRENEKENKK